MELTNFLESNALLALISGDEEEAKRVLRDMLPGELWKLESASDRLSDLARRERYTR